MMTRVVVNGRLAIPCAATLRNELNIWLSIYLNDDGWNWASKEDRP
jgi:hypothetical protein